MKRKFLIRLFIITLFTITTLNTNAQLLHFGVKIFITPLIDMQYYTYDPTKYVFYFANNYNETIRFEGLEKTIDTTNKTKIIPYPQIFIKYESKNHFLARFELFTQWFRNSARYKNSVDFSDYASVFNPSSELENLGYNSIQMKWAFWGTTTTIGYKFFKAKAFRPFVTGGYTLLHLTRLEAGDYYNDTREVRNTIIFHNLRTFKKNTHYSRIGIGFQYHGIEFESYWQANVSEQIDIYANNAAPLDEYNSGIRNYKKFRTLNISLGFNLYSINLLNNNQKQKIKELY